LPDIKSMDLVAIKGYQYLLHLAPEIGKFSEFTRLADIYACGITLYRLVNGDSYLPVVKPHEAVVRAKKGEFPDRNNYRGFIPAAMKKVINKTMAVNPSERYQSAEEMRRALEQVQVAVDWEENLLANGNEWVGTDTRNKIQVERTKQADGTWSVTVKKAKLGKALRRNNAMSKSGLNEKQGMREAYRILQRFVNGKA
jgi:eukaryotic-like serine/threonine-protein kinase